MSGINAALASMFGWEYMKQTYILGPFFYNHWPTSERYLNMQRNAIEDPLALAITQHRWFQQEAASAKIYW